jgi:hypothetical protein
MTFWQRSLLEMNYFDNPSRVAENVLQGGIKIKTVYVFFIIHILHFIAGCCLILSLDIISPICEEYRVVCGGGGVSILTRHKTCEGCHVVEKE